MFHSIRIKNFRCFEDFFLSDLERINLIAGMNNVGKTALLEALFIHLGPQNPELGPRVNMWRGIEPHGTKVAQIWETLFRNLDTKSVIEIETLDEENGRRTLRISLAEPEASVINSFDTIQASEARAGDAYKTATGFGRELILGFQQNGKDSRTRVKVVMEGEKPSFKAEREVILPSFPGVFIISQARYIGLDAERFSKLQEVGKDEIVLSTLRLIEPRLSRLAVLVRDGVPMVHGDIGLGRLLPLPLMGGGMARLLSLVLAIPSAANGVVLIDDFEYGLHYTAFNQIWKALAYVARTFDAQVFATTHSFECIRAAHEALEEDGVYDFRLHRLDRIDGEIRAVSYDREMLTTALVTDLEVR